MPQVSQAVRDLGQRGTEGNSTSAHKSGTRAIESKPSEDHRPSADLLWIRKTCLLHQTENPGLRIIGKKGLLTCLFHSSDQLKE
jgi:hypothetical protein